jgi:hypothetical protein
MKIIWNREKVTRGVQKMLRLMIIAAVKWTPLKTVFIGTDKTRWDKVNSTTQIRRRWENILKNTRGY